MQWEVNKGMTRLNVLGTKEEKEREGIGGWKERGSEGGMEAGRRNHSQLFYGK